MAKWSAKQAAAERVKAVINQNFDLLVKDLVREWATRGETILVFLPGIGEITEVYDTIAPLQGSSASWRFRHFPKVKK